MKDVHTVTTDWVQTIRHSLAFLPVPMIAVAVALGFGLYYAEIYTEISAWVAESLPALEITSQDTARSILSMFIGALITLTVFTFSQIMILLNQVASMYSPRLLPKLTSDRSLQLVMGANLGTIVLTVAVLLSIRSSDDYRIPIFSILICTALGIICLCLFLYFVTAISRRIQVSQVIENVYTDCMDMLDDLDERTSDSRYLEPPNTDGWFVVPAASSGYVGEVDYERLSKLGDELNTNLFLLVPRGAFVPQSLPLLRSERDLSEEEVTKILSAIRPVRTTYDDWYLPNLRQLVEIALKAMSPGINDPGTALSVVDRLTAIFGRLLRVAPHNCYVSEKRRRVYFARYSFDEVLRASLQELRQYSKSDPIVVRSLMQMLYQLLATERSNSPYHPTIKAEIRALLEDARASLTNSRDRTSLANDIRFHRHQVRQLRGRDYVSGEAPRDAPGIDSNLPRTAGSLS